MEKLLKPSIRKGTEESWTNVLPSQPTKNGELGLAVDKMIHLCSVNSEQQLLRRPSWFRRMAFIAIGMIETMWQVLGR